MFPQRPFPHRYFPRRYFAKAGAPPAAATGDLNGWMLLLGDGQVVSYNKAVPITPSDTVDFGTHHGPSSAIYCGGGGILIARFDGPPGAGDVVVPFSVVAGQILPIKAKRIHASGTTAANLVALYAI